MKNKFIKLVISILLPFAAGAIGSYFTIPSINSWYSSLNKPVFSPPDFLFGPVWTILYILMGISFYFVWTSNSPKKDAIRLFLIQLVLNALWSIIFFGLRNPLLAAVEILFLWGAIFLTIKSFAKVSKLSSYLLWTYLAWVTFATILNLSIVFLN